MWFRKAVAGSLAMLLSLGLCALCGPSMQCCGRNGWECCYTPEAGKNVYRPFSCGM